MFHPIQGGNGCSTGPHVPSNPMHDPIAPRAKDTTNRGSAPLVFARRHPDCIPLLLCLGSALALAFTTPIFGHRWCGVQNLIQGKVCGIHRGTNPGLGQHCMPMDNWTWEPCVYKYGCGMGIRLLGVASEKGRVGGCNDWVLDVAWEEWTPSEKRAIPEGGGTGREGVNGEGGGTLRSITTSSLPSSCIGSLAKGTGG